MIPVTHKLLYCFIAFIGVLKAFKERELQETPYVNAMAYHKDSFSCMQVSFLFKCIASLGVFY